MSVKFDWGLFPEAESYLRFLIDDAVRRSDTARRLAANISTGTATDLFDWIDHMALPPAKLDRARLGALGFKEGKRDGASVFRVPDSTLFPVTAGDEEELVLGPEGLADFCAVHFPSVKMGEDFAAFRKVHLIREGGLTLSAVERRGYGGFSAPTADDTLAYEEVLKAFRARHRSHASADEGFANLNALVVAAKGKLSSARIADAFFRAEREQWQAKNKAASVQGARQDAAGVGWGNVDHHTFRSSRENFASLVRFFEDLGLERREQYYAGAKAGWGAQILEHPESGEVVFADVDLADTEQGVDFSREPLSPRDRLGTVGLWVELHGESIFEAGPHHVAARFRFKDAAAELSRHSVAVMKPFSDLPFLKQAFTVGEPWMPRRERIEHLAAKGLIDASQRDRFLAAGAVGSHLETIERRQGFKGFNQDSVSVIIKATDPRLGTASSNAGA